MPSIIETYGLTKDFDMPGQNLSVLKGVHFSIGPKEISFIVGKSGSGKSTLLNLLGGLDKPTSGKILFEGENMTSLSDKEQSLVRNKHIGFVFQFYHLLPELTLYENVMLPAMIHGKPEHAWIRHLLKRVKLLSRKDHYPSELSGGEKQRAALARALVNRPSVVLCDEPTGNLDTESAGNVMELITDIHEQEGQSFVIVTHDEALAWQYPRVYRLHEGVLIRVMAEDQDDQRIEQLP